MKIIETYKDIKSKPRLHGLIRLGLWLIPIVIICIIFRGGTAQHISDSSPKTKTDYLSNLENLEVFKFNYSIDDNTFEGLFYKNTIILKNDSNNFLIKDIYYEKMDYELNNIEYIYPLNIVNRIKNMEIYSTTNYNDESIEYNYIDDTFKISLRVKNEILYKTTIEENDNKIIIEYYDHGNSDFIIDEDKYQNKIEKEDNKIDDNENLHETQILDSEEKNDEY